MRQDLRAEQLARVAARADRERAIVARASALHRSDLLEFVDVDDRYELLELVLFGGPELDELLGLAASPDATRGRAPGGGAVEPAGLLAGSRASERVSAAAGAGGPSLPP